MSEGVRSSIQGSNVRAECMVALLQAPQPPDSFPSVWCRNFATKGPTCDGGQHRKRLECSQTAAESTSDAIC